MQSSYNVVTLSPQSSVLIMPILGSTVLRFEHLASTNDLAREMAASGAEEGIAITAREQTAGRGRLGRTWSSPPGEGLYLSLILRPRLKPGASAVITLAAAVAVAETLILDVHLEVDIKWPNDVLASGRKLCGIHLDADRRFLLPSDIDLRNSRDLADILDQDIFRVVVHRLDWQRVRMNGEKQDRGICGIHLSVIGRGRQVFRQLPAGGIDRRLHVIGRAVDIPVEVELNRDR